MSQEEKKRKKHKRRDFHNQRDIPVFKERPVEMEVEYNEGRGIVCSECKQARQNCLC